MTFLDRLIAYDKDLLVYINSLGTENWDAFWLLVTDQLSWIPLYLLFFYLIFKTFGWKKGLGLVLLTAVLVTFSDQFTVFLKNYFERLRPNRDPSINEVIRILKNNSSFSFVSGHATTSSAVTLFMYLTLRKHFKYTILFFIWTILLLFTYTFSIKRTNIAFTLTTLFFLVLSLFVAIVAAIVPVLYCPGHARGSPD